MANQSIISCPYGRLTHWFQTVARESWLKVIEDHPGLTREMFTAPEPTGKRKDPAVAAAWKKFEEEEVARRAFREPYIKAAMVRMFGKESLTPTDFVKDVNPGAPDDVLDPNFIFPGMAGRTKALRLIMARRAGMSEEQFREIEETREALTKSARREGQPQTPGTAGAGDRSESTPAAKRARQSDSPATAGSVVFHSEYERDMQQAIEESMREAPEAASSSGGAGIAAVHRALDPPRTPAASQGRGHGKGEMEVNIPFRGYVPFEPDYWNGCRNCGSPSHWASQCEWCNSCQEWGHNERDCLGGSRNLPRGGGGGGGKGRKGGGGDGAGDRARPDPSQSAGSSGWAPTAPWDRDDAGGRRGDGAGDRARPTGGKGKGKGGSSKGKGSGGSWWSGGWGDWHSGSQDRDRSRGTGGGRWR